MDESKELQLAKEVTKHLRSAGAYLTEVIELMEAERHVKAYRQVGMVSRVLYDLHEMLSNKFPHELS